MCEQFCHVIRFSRLFFLFFIIFCLAACKANPPRDYGEAKKILRQSVWHDHQITLYCGASYDDDKNVALPRGFETRGHRHRAERMEWEHAVPAENFGRAFPEWREGAPGCVKNGKSYRGRRCAEKASPQYRLMEADMYNLFPSIGSVNAARGNRQYAELPETPSSFGSCLAKVSGQFFEPPARARGQVARAALYMDERYDSFQLSRKQKQLFNAWNKMYPVDGWECVRARRIAALQGNENRFIKEQCQQAGL